MLALMLKRTSALVAAVALLSASAIARAASPDASLNSSIVPQLSTAQAGLILMDNDPSQTAVTEHLLALRAGYRILGLTSVLGDVSAPDGAAHLVRLLELQNLTCIPVVQGAQTPLVRTNATLRTWEAQWGAFPWSGAWRPDYPTGAAQFPFGEPEDAATLQAARNRSAAEFIVEQVRKYPGKQVTLYAAGPLTNVALALRLWPDLATEVKELVIQGGFIDYSRSFSQGTEYEADLWADFNLQLDPEASLMVLSAPFPRITLVGNAANQYIPGPELFTQLNSTARSVVSSQRGENVSADDALGALPSARLFTLNDAQGGFPLWDESAAWLSTLNSSSRDSAIQDSFEAPTTISTAADSPYYGRPYVFSSHYLPSGGVGYRNVTFVNKIDQVAFRDAVVEALTTDWSAYCTS